MKVLPQRNNEMVEANPVFVNKVTSRAKARRNATAARRPSQYRNATNVGAWYVSCPSDVESFEANINKVKSLRQTLQPVYNDLVASLCEYAWNGFPTSNASLL